MGRSISDLLAAKVVLRKVTQVVLPNTVVSQLFGWGLNNRNPKAQGSNTIPHHLREGSYDIRDSTRRVATGRNPGATSSRQKPQKTAKVNFTIPRSAENIELSYEKLNQFRQIGSSVNEVDPQGERYIDGQIEYLAERYGNMIEFQTAAMLRGSYTFDQVGDDIQQGFSGGETEISYQIAAGNKSRLDMTGSGDRISASWGTAGTNIPGDLLDINAGMNTITGKGIEHVVCGSDVWDAVMNNTAVKEQGGSSNTPFESFQRTGPGNFVAVLKAVNWLTWHIVDYSLEIWNGSNFVETKLIAPNHAHFFPNPSNRWTEYMNGMETVVEWPSANKVDAVGFHSWGEEVNNPAGFSLNAVHNGFPALYVPNAMTDATVLF